jgi:hypothetical protein
MNRTLDRMLLAAVFATPLTAATIGHVVAQSTGLVAAVTVTGIFCLVWWCGRRGFLP